MGQVMTHTFVIEGMHCASCPLLIDETLADLDGVLSASTSLRARQATVTIDPARVTPSDVVAAISSAGYPARLESSR